jgi:hypothetical protein
MRFSVLVSIVPEEREEEIVDIARKSGAGGVTILNGKGIGLEEKKVFLGLTYERAESVLVFALEKKLAINVMKAIADAIKEEGISFIIPLEHVMGLDHRQFQKFEEALREGL